MPVRLLKHLDTTMLHSLDLCILPNTLYTWLNSLVILIHQNMITKGRLYTRRKLFYTIQRWMVWFNRNYISFKWRLRYMKYNIMKVTWWIEEFFNITLFFSSTEILSFHLKGTLYTFSLACKICTLELLLWSSKLSGPDTSPKSDQIIKDNFLITSSSGRASFSTSCKTGFGVEHEMKVCKAKSQTFTV